MKTSTQALVISLAFTASLTAQAIQFTDIQPQKSQITFVSKQMGVPVEGKFGKFNAQVTFDPAKPEAAKARIDIDVASIDTGSADANNEVRGKSWFNTNTYSTASFTANGIKPLGGGRYEVRGPLTLKGKSKEIVTVFNLRQEGQNAIFEGQLPLKRNEFGIGEGAWADPSIVSNDVQVRFRLLASSK
jgi:polyisoprenoid-binding protein YceI